MINKTTLPIFMVTCLGLLVPTATLSNKNLSDKKPSKLSQFVEEWKYPTAAALVTAAAYYGGMRVLLPHTTEQATELLVEARRPHNFFWRYFNTYGISSAYCYQFMNDKQVNRDLTIKFVGIPLVMGVVYGILYKNHLERSNKALSLALR